MLQVSLDRPKISAMDFVDLDASMLQTVCCTNWITNIDNLTFKFVLNFSLGYTDDDLLCPHCASS